MANPPPPRKDQTITKYERKLFSIPKKYILFVYFWYEADLKKRACLKSEANLKTEAILKTESGLKTVADFKQKLVLKQKLV